MSNPYSSPNEPEETPESNGETPPPPPPPSNPYASWQDSSESPSNESSWPPPPPPVTPSYGSEPPSWSNGGNSTPQGPGYYGQAGSGSYGPPPPAHPGGGYGPSPYHQVAPGTDHPRTVLVFVLGIIGVLCCQLLAPVVWYLGHTARQETKANPAYKQDNLLLNVGWVLGMVGTGLLVLSLIFNGFGLISGLSGY